MSLSLLVLAHTISIVTSLKSNGSPIPPPPAVSVPVYSLSTAGTTTSSMNIVTFATPVSIKPKLYMISLYYGTKTRDVFVSDEKSQGHGILQLLDQSHKSLVPLLGKRSGYEEGYSKEQECRQAGFPWNTIHVEGETLFSSRTYLGSCNDSVETDDDRHDAAGTSSSIRIFDGTKVIPNCQSYIAVKIVETMEAGDHEMALCEVMGVGAWNDEMNCVVSIDDIIDDGKGVKAKDEDSGVLYTSYLRKEGIL